MAEEPNTVKFYSVCSENLLASKVVRGLKLSAITAEAVTAYVSERQNTGMAVATINRELSTLRRALHLANEWGVLQTAPPRIMLLKGESCLRTGSQFRGGVCLFVGGKATPESVRNDHARLRASPG